MQVWREHGRRWEASRSRTALASVLAINTGSYSGLGFGLGDLLDEETGWRLLWRRSGRDSG